MFTRSCDRCFEVGEGQIFEFDPRRQTLTPIYDSPSGLETWLFVNIQTPGITFAITAPGAKDPL